MSKKKKFRKDKEYKIKLRAILYSKGEYPKCKGVYKITNNITGAFYIGSSNSIYKRFASHLLALKYKKHANYKLAIDFSKHGEESFVFEIVEKCSNSTTRNEIYELEQKYIDELKPTYNIKLTVEIPGRKQNKPTGKVKRLACVEPVLHGYTPNRVRRNRNVKVNIHKHHKKQHHHNPPKKLVRDPLTEKLKDFNEARRLRDLGSDNQC